MNGTGLITLLTDFGLDDPYVGVLKAVLLQGCPSARMVDLSHALQPYDTRAAAFWIERVFGWFPARTVHVVVVDPGVGSPRRAIVVAAHGQFFVGPDNGVLSGIYARDPQAEARDIIPGVVGLAPPSRTFHARDVFAPVAAGLAQGTLVFEKVGGLITTLAEAVLPLAVESGTTLVGQVVAVDHFGNALTNLSQPPLAGRYEARVGGHRLPIVGTYADGAVGDIFALFGSFGTLELAMREGHAATALGVSSGTLVELYRVG
jgi:S-adenosylmethionine hydrolase